MTSTQNPPDAVKNRHLYYLYNLRVVLIMLVIAHHVGQT